MSVQAFLGDKKKFFYAQKLSLNHQMVLNLLKMNKKPHFKVI